MAKLIQKREMRTLYFTKFNRHERYTIYCLMLAEFESNREEYVDTTAGLCMLMDNATGIYPYERPHYYWNIPYNLFKNVAPELIKRKPKGIAFGNLWFSKDEAGWKKRIRLLKDAIKELEIKLYNK